jgi:hypothetical protein
MSSSIAGATTTGQTDERYTASKRLSHKPLAIFAMVLHEAGAISITSAQRPSDTWLAQVFSSNKSISTLFLERVENVSGETKPVAYEVIITFTSAPDLINNLSKITDLYAAILPVTHNKIFRPLSIYYFI